MANTLTTLAAPLPNARYDGDLRSMSPMQLQAYLVARETLRRLKSAPTPQVPPDVSLSGSAGTTP